MGDEFGAGHMTTFMPCDMLRRLFGGRSEPDIEERFFYHSFPRRGRDTVTEINKGCEVLALIRDAGLLLTPEVVQWQYGHPDGSQRIEPVLQTRACFTELAPRELARHAAEFGHFALEFKIETLRSLGAIPVFYVPRPGTFKEASLEELGAVLAIQLIDAKNLANQVARLNAAVASPGVVGTQLTIEHGGSPGSKRQFNLAAPEVRRVLEAVTYGVTPGDMLSGGLNGLLSFFYPADDVARDKALHYYRQREWRIAGNLALRGQSVMRKPTVDEVSRLRQIDAEFFSRNLRPPWEGTALLDECLVYPGLGGKRVIELVNRVIVPQRAVGRVREILKGLSRSPPVVSLPNILAT